MLKNRGIATGTLAAAVADSATLAVTYPARAVPGEQGNTDEGDYFNAIGHKLVMGQALLTHPKDFDITLTTSTITVTNKTGASWPVNTKWTLELNVPGKAVFADNQSDSVNKQRMARMSRSDSFLINLGAADTLVTDGVLAQQNRTNAGALLVNGSIAVGGVAILDCPRNLIAKSGGADTAVITVTGKDEYGVTMVETLTLNGTTAVNGKKAFKSVSAASASAAVSNTAFIGTGDVLGLPAFLPSAGYVIKELENGTAATAGTFVAGFKTAGGHTATGADVRGTYDPNSACDADKVFQLVVCLPDGGERGVPQFAG
jgi:hypothetical protein